MQRNFDGAERVEGTLVFDETVVDTNPDPDAGSYPGALVSLTATVEGPGYVWSADAGSLQTFPDTGFGDQFSANSPLGGASGHPVNGYPIRSLGVLFFGEDVLAGDALPGPPAGFDVGNLFVSFRDDFDVLVGQATLTFAVPEPSGPAAALAAWTVLATLARRARVSGAAGARHAGRARPAAAQAPPDRGVTSALVQGVAAADAEAGREAAHDLPMERRSRAPGSTCDSASHRA
jgi:hypothetical protein